MRAIGWLAVAGLALAGCRAVPQNTALRESVEETLFHGGVERTYRLYDPASRDPETEVPLLVALHGGGGDGRSMERLTRFGFNRIADREGFLVAYPDGLDRRWRDGRGAREGGAGADVDDVGFLAALIDHLAERFAVDRNRVFVTGMSNGAMMSHRFGAERPDRVAAIACVAGGVPRRLVTADLPRRRIAVLSIRGTKDPLVPWEGGAIGFGLGDLGTVLSGPASLYFWAGREALPRIEPLPDGDPEDGMEVFRWTFENPGGGPPAVLLEIHGGGHTWPGGWQYLPGFLIGPTLRAFDACASIWSFFSEKDTMHSLE